MKKRLAPTLMIMGLVFGCAKEKDYDEVNKISDLKFSSAFQSKQSLLDMCTTNDPCVYVPSVTNTPYQVEASRPFWQGEQRLVVAKLDDLGTLKYIQLDPDNRFNSNVNNNSPVLNFEVEHVDYKCSEDQFGDCTNKEEEDSDKDWRQRNYVKIKDISVVESNTLPIEFSEMLGGGCFSEVDKSITKFDIEKEAINVVVKKTYKTNFKCANISTYSELMEKLRYLTFSVDYAYSIVKLSTLADKNYPVIDYPQTDESTFGFFTTEQTHKTVDHHTHYMGTRKTLMNRWSPNKKELVYYLNQDFYLPEMKDVLESTYDSIEAVNKSLELAKANFKIVLKPGKDSDIGDLRKNFIILVKDPQESGVIGYGPTVANPLTGEILNARTVMYFGTIQKYVGDAYDELVEEVIKVLQNRRAEAEAAQSANPAQNNSPEQNAAGLSSESMQLIKDQITLEYAKYVSDKLDLNNLERIFKPTEDMIIPRENSEADSSFEKLYSKLKEKLEKGESEDKSFIEKLAKQTFYHGSQVNYDDIVLNELLADVENEKGIAYWKDLTEEKRAYYMKKLLPFTFIGTLVHEFGHNLGLRHNFYGSVDPENFYSQAETEEHGLRNQPTYSSIMDYAPRRNNFLKFMGKYDIAALRFAYTREVETADNSFIKVESTLEDLAKENKLKKYKFCTDEHVDSDPLCNRHDEGTNFESVVDYHISQYKKYYELVNFRNRRYSYEARNGDLRYFNYLIGRYQEIYQFFAAFDGAAKNGAYDGDEWKDNPVLVDLKKASDKAFDFFMDIIEEPAYHCVEIDKKKGTVTKVAPFVEMAKGTQLENFGITFDIANGCLFLNTYGREGMAYAQFGKYLNNSIDVTIDKTQILQGDSSQMDVRGMWQDKVLATLFTGLRAMKLTTIGAASGGNFLDYKEYKERMLNSINGIMTNRMMKKLDVTLPDGRVVEAELPYTIESSHMVNKSYNPMINAIMGLSNSRTNLKNILLRFLKAQLASEKDEGDIESAQALTDFYYFDIDRISTREDVSRYNYDKIIEFKNSTGVINYRFGAYSYNKKAMELAQMKDSLELLEIAEKEDISLAMVVLEGEMLEYLKAQTRLTREELMSFIQSNLDIEVLKATNKLSEAEINEIEQMMTAQVNPQMIFMKVAELTKYSAEEIEALSKIEDQLHMLKKSGEVPANKIKDIELIVNMGIDTVNGYQTGTLTPQVLLSSFLALSK